MKNLLLIVLILYLFATGIILFPKDHSGIPECAESGVCKEGIKYNAGNGYFIVNKQTCKENGGEWMEINSSCFFY